MALQIYSKNSRTLKLFSDSCTAICREKMYRIGNEWSLLTSLTKCGWGIPTQQTKTTLKSSYLNSAVWDRIYSFCCMNRPRVDCSTRRGVNACEMKRSVVDERFALLNSKYSKSKKKRNVIENRFVFCPMIWLANTVIKKSVNVNYIKSQSFSDIDLVIISVLKSSLRQKLRNITSWRFKLSDVNFNNVINQYNTVPWRL